MGNNLKEIRKKISSVQNTQKTTKAMKLVSTSRLKKAEDVAKSSLVFAQKLNELFEEVIQRASSIGFENIITPIFNASKKRDVKSVDLIVITAEKGLCGSFNQSTIKTTLQMMEAYQKKGISIRLRIVGRKGISYFSYNQNKILDSLEGLSANPDYKLAAEFLSKSIQDFIDYKTDEVVVIYNGFKTMVSQEIKVKKLLPFGLEAISRETKVIEGIGEIEPCEDSDQILEELAQKYMEYNFYFALLDSLVAEHSARAQAMDAATNNAGNLVKNLIVSYNKARQEAITTELVEINAGVEAMK